MSNLDSKALGQLFINAKTHSYWLDKDVPSALLTEIYDLCKMGSTSANCQPMRTVFIKSTEAKEKLRPCLFEGNIEKTMAAPVTAIFAYDMEFFDQLAITFPHVDAKPWFTQSENDTFMHSFRNANLQAAYFMLAARAQGLDCGPMSGFNAQLVDDLFFHGTKYKSNFLCNLGYGDQSKTYDRLPRLSFDQTCKVV
ncbi:MAG: malonic semialdehyde reductase [Candidatus Paracaedibacteraceae bacterium]|nr:malonic semialdehyde reductase [Candidatus Paracaedibacteraceae bacterium]